MASCIGMQIKSGDESKVYLEGSITGLSPSKEYCLMYLGSSSFTNLPNSRLDYTYFRNQSSFNMDGCYVPLDRLKSDGSFSVRLFEVRGNCESVVEILCIKDMKYIEATDLCRLDFLVFDNAWNPMNGVVCRAYGKSAITSGGFCSINVPCGQLCTARCDIPSGYTCDCGGCCCEDGPFILTGNGLVNFFLKKITEPEEYCQQNFKVVDQNGNPVENVIIGGEDQSDFTNFDIMGHGGSGTERDGTVATLQTVGGRSYKFYISIFPAGYDSDVDGISVVGPLNACTGEILFRIKNLSVVPGACSVNVCTQDQFGDQITGVAIDITNVGTVYTKQNLDMFGCTGEIGVECGSSIRVSATVPEGYEAMDISKSFVAEGKKTIILTLRDLTPDPDKVDLTINVPSFAMAGTIEISGTGPTNENVHIMAEKGGWMDIIISDKELGDTMTNEEGKYSVEIELDAFGSAILYAKIEKGGFWDWIVEDIYSKKHSVWVLTQTVVIALLISAGLIIEKKYNMLGLFKGGKK